METAGDKPRLLLLWWSQTGQLRDAAEAFVQPFEQAGWNVHRAELRPQREYPFPWQARAFFSAFPETVAGPPPELEALEVDADRRFDLVVLAYQVWFLAPSPPVQGLFATPAADLLRDTPVLTLVACRNMWYTAAVRLRRQLDAAGARYAGNVAAVDRSPAWATFVMTPRWLMTGRTDPLLGMPSPGIGEDGIEGLRQAGATLVDEISAGASPEVSEHGADLDLQIALADRLGGIAFRAWARAIRRAPAARPVLLTAFVAWLAASIVFLLPIIALTHRAMRRSIDLRTLTWIRCALRPTVQE